MLEPPPKNVTITLTNGMVVPCDVRYDGLTPDGDTRWKVVFEVDWSAVGLRVGIATMDAEYVPPNVWLIIDLPGVTPEEGRRIMSTFTVADADVKLQNRTR